MYLEKLAKYNVSGANKGEQAYVDVKNTKLNDKEPVEFKIAQDLFEYPQFGPQIPVDEKGKPTRQRSDEEAQAVIDEFVANAGSVQQAADVIQDITRTAAVNYGKNYIRTATTGDRDTIVDAGLKRVRDFTWAEEKKITAAEAKDIVQTLVASDIASKSADELKAMLLALLPK